MNNSGDYGHWVLVAIHSFIFLIFAFSFFQPRTRRDWRTFGAFNRFPEVDWFSHNAGHLVQTVLGWQGYTHFGPLHIISDLLILAGFVLLVKSWSVLYRAQLNHSLAITGPYARMRHPQYVAFIVIMVGFLIQWPTLATVVMFPILVLIYVRLAQREEKEVLTHFGERYARYAEKTPRFFPRLWGGRESFGHVPF
jgi:protein-S-isoprenylcysteine O-methyltransferase Ste14